MHSHRRQLWLSFIVKLLIGLSDQQLITTLALQITVALKMCELTSYHLNIVLYIVTSTICCYSFVVNILQEHLRRRSYLAILRAALVGLSAIILFAQYVFSQVYRPSHPDGLALPIMCHSSRHARGNAIEGFATFLMIALLPLSMSILAMKNLRPSLYFLDIPAGAFWVLNRLFDTDVVETAWIWSTSHNAVFKQWQCSLHCSQQSCRLYYYSC
jgi:hypothetical protein